MSLSETRLSPSSWLHSAYLCHGRIGCSYLPAMHHFTTRLLHGRLDTTQNGFDTLPDASGNCSEYAPGHPSREPPTGRAGPAGTWTAAPGARGATPDTPAGSAAHPVHRTGVRVLAGPMCTAAPLHTTWWVGGHRDRSARLPQGRTRGKRWSPCSPLAASGGRNQGAAWPNFCNTPRDVWRAVRIRDFARDLAVWRRGAMAGVRDPAIARPAWCVASVCRCGRAQPAR